jgi:hypothetical protein
LKISWRIAIVTVLAPLAGTAEATQPLAAALKSPLSFDEALAVDYVRPVHLLEPTLADDPAAPTPPAASQAATPSVSSGSYSDCGCETCDCGDMCNSYCGPLWSVRAGAAILERTNDNDRRTLVRSGGASVAATDDFDFDFAGGPNVTLTRWLRNGTGIETCYFGALEWEADESFTTPGAWTTDTIPPISGINSITIDAKYISRLNSTEINWRGSPNQTVAWLAGFRWVELHEELNADLNIAEIGLNTDNHIYGGQLGAILQLLQNGGPLSAEAWFKGGVYGNDADSEFSLDTIGPDFAGKAERGQTAFVGDIAVSGAYMLSDNLAFRSGYQLLWIEGVALAGDQVNATNFTTGQGINTKGGVFYHGALVSFDLVW